MSVLLRLFRSVEYTYFEAVSTPTANWRTPLFDTPKIDLAKCRHVQRLCFHLTLFGMTLQVKLKNLGGGGEYFYILQGLEGINT